MTLAKYLSIFCFCLFSALSSIAQPPPPDDGGGGGGGGGSIGISGAGTVCYNKNYTFYATGSPSSYSWTISGGYITGSTTSSSVVARFTQAGGSGTIILNGSATKVVSVLWDLAAGYIGGVQTICYGETAAVLYNSTSPSGGSGSGNFWYQWQQYNGSWVDISGAHGLSYAPGTLYSTTQYRRKVIDDACQTEGYSNTITVTVNGYMSVPSSSGGAQCGAGNIYMTAAYGSNANTIQWWNASSGGSLLATSTSYTTPYISTTTTYYINSYNTSTGCASSRIPVNATIYTIPSVPSTVNDNTCYNQTAVLTAIPGANGNDILWYTASSGGSAIYQGATFTTPALTATTNYYAATLNTSNGCVSSSRTLAVATVDPTPSAATGSDVYVCGPGYITLNASYGSHAYTVRWYTTPTGGTPFKEGMSHTTTGIVTTSITYYVTGYNTITGCESLTRTAISGYVNPVPSSPTPTNSGRCAEGTVTLGGTPGANGNTLRWYTSSSGGSMLQTGTSYTIPTLTTTTTYYISSYNSTTGCESPPPYIAVTATINPYPGSPSAKANNVIFGSGTTQITAIPEGGDEVKWYDVPTGGSPSYTGATLTTPLLSSTRTYYLATRNSTTTCESPQRTPVNATVLNYVAPSSITSENVRVSGITEDEQIYTLTPTEKNASITYVDGLHRKKQQVAIASSPGGYDVVAFNEYDALGRQSASYLPYVASTTNGSFQSAAKTNQLSFYATAGDKIANDTAPFATLEFEDAPSGRVLKKGNIGADWQIGTNHEQKFSYSFNVSSDNVRKFSSDGSSTGHYTANELRKVETTDENGNKVITFTDALGRAVLKRVQLDDMQEGTMVDYLETYTIYDDFGRVKYTLSPKAVAAFAANSWTFSQSVIDEFGYEYKYDSLGRVIEKKVPGSAWVYYGYDDLDRLVLMQDGILRGTNQWMFIKYDKKHRAVMQGLYTDAVNVTRSAIQSVLDGLYTSTNATYPENAWYESRGTALENYTNNSFPKTNQNASALSILSVNYYDDHDFDNSGTDDYSYVSQGLAGEGIPASAYGRPTGSKRKILNTSTWLYTYVFYDKYGRPIQVRSDNHVTLGEADLLTRLYDFEGKVLKEVSSRPQKALTWKNLVNVGTIIDGIKRTATTNGWNGGASSVQEIPAGTNGWIEATVSETNTNRMIGLSDIDSNQNYNTLDYAFYLNGTSLKVYENGASKFTVSGALTTGTKLKIERTGTTVKYYRNGLLVYTSLTPSSTKLMADMSLNTAGATLSQIRLSVAQGTLSIVKSYTYDAKGRATEIKQNINSTGDQVVAKYVYNELGQLVDKQLHDTGGNNFLQSVDYRYNIRGWLQSINNAQLTNDGSINDDMGDFFGMEMLYNNVETGLNNSAYYNGNISAIKWKGAGDGSGAEEQRSYKYIYDKSDRLKDAAFQMRGTSSWDKHANMFNEAMTYDVNGNMMSLKRHDDLKGFSGLNATHTATLIDNLTYTYATGNKLSKVEDATSDVKGFSNGSTATTEYEYDTNGNVTKDLNKNINSIAYNILGKPSVITFSGTPAKTITYTYDAAGTKLKMAYYDGTTTTTTDYVDGFVYTNNALNFFSSPEGRVVKNGSNYEYQYAITDHQGNTRVMFTSADPVAQPHTATFETGTQTTEQANFQNYPTGGNRSSLGLFDHTDAGTTYTYSQLLHGGNGSQVGLAKSFKVFPGDKVKIEAYAKYWNETSTTSNLSGFAAALAGAFGVSSGSTGEALKAYTGLNNYGGVVAAGGGSGSTSSPKAFVNILIFDKDYKFLDIAFQQISTNAEQVGASPVVDHEYLMSEYDIKEAGYAYIYVSNENATQVDVYFDDITMTYTPNRVIQSSEYYPFGLQTANSWTRESSKNDYLYNAGSELNAASGWYEMFYRGYDPALGRMLQVDPMASSFTSVSPYNYSFNDPVFFNDPSGASPNNGIPIPTSSAEGPSSGGGGKSFFSLGGKIGLGSGGHWADGINYSDWMGVGGSQIYRDGIAMGLTDWGGYLYRINGDGSKDNRERYEERAGVGGFWKDEQFTDYFFEGGKLWSSPGVKSTFVQQTQGGPGDPGLDWQGGWEALVRMIVPFGSDIYPVEEGDPSKRVIEGTVPNLPIGPTSLGNLRNLGAGLRALFKNGVSGNSIINIRSTLLNNGFTQTITNNGSGYLFTNSLGEQVRIMSRAGTWDVRIMNQFGNYLDELGNIAAPSKTHGIIVFPK